MHWRFALNSALVIKPSERSDVNTLRRCFRVWVSEAFGTSNEGTGAGRNFDTRKKGIGVSVDDQSNQIHIMTARSDIGISSEGLQMQWTHTVWFSGGVGCRSDGDINTFLK